MITLDMTFEGNSEEQLTFNSDGEYEVKFGNESTEFNLSFEIV